MATTKVRTVGSNPRVAIVGGGISAIACSWKLRQSPCFVDIYEERDKLGGHANSVLFAGQGHDTNVDTGFIAFHEATYPKFTNFLQELKTSSLPTDMSFSVSAFGGALEWGSYSVWSFFGNISNFLSPWYWRMAFDLMRFCLFAPDILLECRIAPADGEGKLDLPRIEPESIGDYLRRYKYSEQFLQMVLVPMVAAPWCNDPDHFARDFPAKALLSFMVHHGLLSTITRQLKWHSFKNGSRSYLDAFQESLPREHRLYLNTPVSKVVNRSKNGACIMLSNGHSREYDYVVLAVHANQALKLLHDNATLLERRILGCFKTTRNLCVLHSDTSLLPRRKSARTAWNCHLHSENSRYHARHEKNMGLLREGSKISITFDMNKLQAIPLPGRVGSPGRVLVTMNPLHEPCFIQSKHIYYHPLINAESIAATKQLCDINGLDSIAFAGAWMGYGFHEDGFAAGEHAAELLIRGRDYVAPLELINEVEVHRNARTWAVTLARYFILLIQVIIELRA